ncbi:MAG: trypsin-like peptidase domain-containing protein [Anaerolineae bacterium]|nr:trypsin-like peptidase domain-containing protein [Anaerolineae bacterium]
MSDMPGGRPPVPSTVPPLNKRMLLITFVTAGLIILCMGSILLFASLGLSALFSEPALSTSVQLPDAVTAGEEFTLRLEVVNDGDRAVKLSEVRFSKTIFEGSDLLSSQPAYSEVVDYSGRYGYKYAVELQPRQSAVFTFRFKALYAGLFEGEVWTMTGTRAKTAPATLTVLPADEIQPEPTPQPSATPQVLQPLPPTLGRVPYQAVVQIIAGVMVNDRIEEGWTGSGTFISADGLVLTNAHVVLSDRYYQVEELVVAVTTAQDQPPEPRYKMELLQVDEALDIAIGRITTDLDDNPLDASQLNLPFVPLGNSDELQLGDSLVILGYPGIGGETITLTRGEVAGFTADPDFGNRAFVKTSATIAGGNSGGLAANENGELIGVPTQLGYGGDGEFVDCRVLADTNRDGVVNDLDDCVPTGGFINAFRPIKLALPYIEAAKRGEVNIQQGVTGDRSDLQPRGTAIFKDNFSDAQSGWPEDDLTTGAVRYAGGAYEIEVNDTDYVIWSPLDLVDTADVLVEVSARAVEPTGEGEFGVICRYQDEDNYYSLEISEDRYFSIWKREGGEFFAIYDWEYSDAIPESGTVTLTAACSGNELALAVNDMLLISVEDNTFDSGQVGLLAGTFGTPNLVVAFDDFAVYKP